MGASGSGKSTLLNCISAIDSVISGSILLENVEITSIEEYYLADFRRDKLGFIFQDFNLLDTLIIEENIALTLVIQKVFKDHIFDKVCNIARNLGTDSI